MTVNQKTYGKENSIVVLEEKIEKLRLASRTKTRTSEIKRLQVVLNRVYVEYKRKIMEFEKGNYEYLALLRSTHGFHKILGNSLYFYAFNITPKLNLDAKIFSDGDYEEKSQAGVISVKDLDEPTEVGRDAGDKTNRIRFASALKVM